MDRLEKGSGNTVLSEREAQALLKDDQDLVLAVYDYWLAKRLRLVSQLDVGGEYPLLDFEKLSLTL